MKCLIGYVKSICLKGNKMYISYVAINQYINNEKKAI